MTGWFDLPRVPEPEVMDDSGEVEAYAGNAAEAYLDKIDNTFVAHALQMLGAPDAIPRTGNALDIGTGPGQIVRKLARHLPGWELVGVDRSPNMISEAISERDRDAPDARMEFLLADGSRLPFADASFDLVLCNSVLHHVERPASLFAEIARVSRRQGAILIRDLRRPVRLTYPLHVRWYGRHYAGLMYKLYCDSVRAAYTREELTRMLRDSPLAGARVFERGRTHVGIARAARR